MISFKTTDYERQQIAQCAARTIKMMGRSKPRKVKHEDLHRDICMDIAATHANGTPLDLDKLLAFDDFNFAHDVFGIRQHIDRNTGKLTGHFLPRSYRPRRSQTS